ncbi:MAG TPA: 3-phosphoserine/phosphohydroxythreonine transaminase [bacterium]|jgi:phosphoserine aminotransferase|nr:3-phosphoserine/phosphohydroxythreonine transaminase [bacterium]
MKRIYNFAAGPAILPVPVLEEASKNVLEIAGSGMSVLELSHRGKIYETLHQEARSHCLALMGLKPEDYTVLFLGGGASQQFATIPMNFLRPGATADYVDGGEWGSKAIKEAKGLGTVNVAASSAANKHSSLPVDFKWTPGAAYAHLTTNNTIEGTQMRVSPETGSPLILDASSDFLSHGMDWSKASLVYAGAQKNAGPAGLTIVVIKKSFLATAKTDIPAIFQYAVHDKADSLYNTPPAFPIYVFGLVLKWIESQGGIAGIEKRNQRKAQLIYDALDSNADFYDAAVTKKEDRSWMNITWRVRDAAKEEAFLKGAKERQMDGLKGHRNVGGFRASVYNAFPEEGCAALAQYLKEFAKQ